LLDDERVKSNINAKDPRDRTNPTCGAVPTITITVRKLLVGSG
jgi:hypothetical protein